VSNDSHVVWQIICSLETVQWL